jgi:hypothetical protein
VPPLRILRRIVPTVLVLGAAVTVTAHAQPASPTGAPRVRVGLVGGLASSSITDFDLNTIGGGAPGGPSLETRRRTGWQGGLYATVPLNATFSLQPELHLAMRGSVLALEGQAGIPEDPPFDGDGLEFRIKLTYLELPLLLRADLWRSDARWRPFLVAGPTVARRTKCSVGFAAEGASVDVACDELGDEEEGSRPDPFETFDAGAVAGLGVAGALNGKPVALQLRYARGVSTITTASTAGVAPKNTAILLLASFGFR